MWVYIITALTYFVGLAIIIFVVMQRKEPAATLAWIFVIITLPIVGVLLFLWFGYGRIQRKVHWKQRTNQVIAEQLEGMEQVLESSIVNGESLDTHVQKTLAQVSEGKGAYAITRANALHILTEPEAAFTELVRLINNANDSINMVYYIFRNDDTGKHICNLLIEAAKRGVAVRLLVDGVGSWNLGFGFSQKLKKAGVQFARYLPVTPLGRPWHWNLRNHRKITIVDGTAGIIGSANIGDEYRFRHGHKSDFYDYQMLCQGPLVQQLQEVFAEDWFFATRENLIAERYFPLIERSGTDIGQVIASGPDDPQSSMYEMFCTAIHAAKERVRIVSPYFIPDQALLVALRTAARRGVEIQLLVARHFPTLHEHIIYFAERSYYQELLASGIRMYEYLPGFLHAKSITVDGAWASVGTANMDIRSFKLNFEVNVNIYSKETIHALNQQFEKHLEQCKEIDLENFCKRGIGVQCLENTLRVFSPIL